MGEAINEDNLFVSNDDQDGYMSIEDIYIMIISGVRINVLPFRQYLYFE